MPAGLIAWYSSRWALYQDAGRTVPAVNNGDPVGSITDIIGGYHLTAVNAGTLDTNPGYSRGIRGIIFDGVNDYYSNPTLGTNIAGNDIPCTMVVVGRNQSNRQMCGLGSAGVASFRLTTSGNGATNCTRRDDANNNIIAGQATPAIAQQSLRMFWARGPGPLQSGYGNVFGPSQNALTLGQSTFTTFVVGADSIAFNSFWSGEMAEILVYRSQLTDNQILLLYRYFQGLYDLV